jgi:hypothetical protein
MGHILCHPAMQETHSWRDSELWFDHGMVHFRDPDQPELICKKTIEDVRTYVRNFLIPYCQDEEFCCKEFACTGKDLRNFAENLLEKLKEWEKQLHVGAPIDALVNHVQSKKSVSVRALLESKKDASSLTQRPSGLIVPESNS